MAVFFVHIPKTGGRSVEPAAGQRGARRGLLRLSMQCADPVSISISIYVNANPYISNNSDLLKTFDYTTTTNTIRTIPDKRLPKKPAINNTHTHTHTQIIHTHRQEIDIAI